MSNGRFAQLARRTVSLPISSSKSAHASSPQDAQLLFQHVATVFSLSRPVPAVGVLPGLNRDGSLGASVLPWTSAHDKLLATGKMEISSRPDFPPFITIGSVFFKPILKNTQCWSVDGSAKFVLSGQSPTSYLRLEMQLSTELDIIKLKSFTDILAGLCQFETTACPFDRTFNAAVPPRIQVPKKPWSRKTVISAPERGHSSSITTTTIELGLNDVESGFELWRENRHPLTAPVWTNRDGTKPFPVAELRHNFKPDKEPIETGSHSSLQMRRTLSPLDPAVEISSPLNPVDNLTAGHVRLCESPLGEQIPSHEVEEPYQQRNGEFATSAGQKSLEDYAHEDVNLTTPPNTLPSSIELDLQGRNALPASDPDSGHWTPTLSNNFELRSPKYAIVEKDRNLRYRGKTAEPVTVRQSRRISRAAVDSESLIYLLWKTLLVLFLRLLVQIKTRVEHVAPVLRTYGSAKESSDEDLQPSLPGRWSTRILGSEIDEHTTEDIRATPTRNNSNQ